MKSVTYVPGPKCHLCSGLHTECFLFTRDEASVMKTNKSADQFPADS